MGNTESTKPETELEPLDKAAIEELARGFREGLLEYMDARSEAGCTLDELADDQS